jgi:hypothetical protein
MKHILLVLLFCSILFLCQSCQKDIILNHVEQRTPTHAEQKAGYYYGGRLPLVGFSWDKHDEAVQYKLQVSEQANFDTLVLDTVMLINADSFYLQNNQLYYWRVLYQDDKGLWSERANNPTWFFKTLDTRYEWAYGRDVTVNVTDVVQDYFGTRRTPIGRAIVRFIPDPNSSGMLVYFPGGERTYLFANRPSRNMYEGYHIGYWWQFLYREGNQCRFSIIESIGVHTSYWQEYEGIIPE